MSEKDGDAVVSPEAREISSGGGDVPTPPGGRRSRIVRFRDFSWEGIEERRYRREGCGWRGVTRHVLVGEGEDAPFHVRYFEAAPGGHTTHERHHHVHVVVPIRGRGEVRLNEQCEEIGFGDVVYVAPDDPHQFRCVGGEPFGFLCIVSGERDRPVRVPE